MLQSTSTSRDLSPGGRVEHRRRPTALRFRGLALVVLTTSVLATSAAPGQEESEIASRPAINPGLGAVAPQVARSTPAASWRSFLTLGAAGDYGAAAHLLDLSEVAVEGQGAVGRDVARKLYRVVRAVGAEVEAVTSEEPGGPSRDGRPANVVVATRFQRPGIAGEIWLRRTRDEQTGELAWLFTRQTVANASPWYRVLVEGKPLGTTEELNAGLGPPPVTVQRRNPRETLTGFLSAAGEGKLEVAAHYLDLNRVEVARQSVEGPRLARRLMLLMLLKVGLDPDVVSNDAAGAPEVELAEDQERVATLDAKGRTVDITLSRHLDRQQGLVWAFSEATVDQVDRLYEASGYGWIGDRLPVWFLAVSFLGLQLWQWLALLLIAGVGWAMARVVGHWAMLALGGIARRTRVTWDDAFLSALDGPSRFILWGLVLAAGASTLGMSPEARETAHSIWRLLLVVGIGWLLFRLVDVACAQLRALEVGRDTLAQSFVPIIRRIGRVLVVFLALLASLDVVGVNVMAGLAGLGLGGLAVAFAAQKTLENVFGAIAIAADRPFTVGDFVRVGDVPGTVEDIGLRSTKLRTLERTLVSIPNSAVVGDKIVNFAERDRILYNPTIGLVYGTTAAQLTFVVDEIRRLLLHDPRVYLDAQRTRFKEFGAFSLNVEVVAWVNTTDYAAFTAIAEDLNFRIMEIVERSGSSFAFPSQTLYLGRDPGLAPARAEEVAREVARRRSAGDLVVPEPSEEQLERARAERGGA